MATPFRQLINDLWSAQDDPERLALVTFDFAVKDDPALRSAVETVAIPHWFDEKILAALLPEYADRAAQFLEQIAALPMVETYPNEDREPAWNLHEATRRAIRRRLISDELDRFLSVSHRAADYFSSRSKPLDEGGDWASGGIVMRIEAVCHRLLSSPEAGAHGLSSLVDALLANHHLERLQRIAGLVIELLEDGTWGRCAASLRQQNAMAWAEAQSTLAGSLYDLGICTEPDLGNRLFAAAVIAHRAALEIYTCEALPRDWAGTQNNLANLLCQQAGNSEDEAGLKLLDQAVTAYKAALEIFTRKNFPQEWAMTQNNLANALGERGNRSEGEKGLELLGQAVVAYRATLEVYTREAAPRDWAMTQNNLGATLQGQGVRSEGRKRLELLGEAVSAYQAALEIRTRESVPQDWAMTQNNLAAALHEQSIRTRGKKGLKLLAQAVEAYHYVLEVYTRESLPQRWAMTQNNLANSLGEQGMRSEGKVGLELLDQAVKACRAALEVRRREDMPQGWATTQNNLGVSLASQADRSEEKAEKERLYWQAEAAYLAALEVRTIEGMPHDRQQTLANLEKVRQNLKALKPEL